MELHNDTLRINKLASYEPWLPIFYYVNNPFYDAQLNVVIKKASDGDLFCQHACYFTLKMYCGNLFQRLPAPLNNYYHKLLLKLCLEDKKPKELFSILSGKKFEAKMKEFRKMMYSICINEHKAYFRQGQRNNEETLAFLHSYFKKHADENMRKYCFPYSELKISEYRVEYLIKYFHKNYPKWKPVFDALIFVPPFNTSLFRKYF